MKLKKVKLKKIEDIQLPFKEIRPLKVVKPIHFQRPFESIQPVKIVKSKIKMPEYMTKYDEMFNSISSGDIIYVNSDINDIDEDEKIMDKAEKILSKAKQIVTKQQNNSYYLVVQKTKDHLLAYPGYPDKRDHNMQFVIKKKHNSEYHDEWTSNHIYFDMNLLYSIPKKKVLNILDSLTYHDIKVVERKIRMIEKDGKEVIHMEIPMRVEAGDICSIENQLWYIYKFENAKYYGHPVYKYEVLNSVIVRHGDVYYIDVNEYRKFDHIDDYPVEWSLSPNAVLTVKEKKQMVLDFLNKKIHPRKGFYVKHTPGTKFIDSIQGVTIVYLFNINTVPYGLYLEDIESEDADLYIQKMKSAEYLKQDGIYDQGLKDILEFFVDIKDDFKEECAYLLTNYEVE